MDDGDDEITYVHGVTETGHKYEVPSYDGKYFPRVYISDSLDAKVMRTCPSSCVKTLVPTDEEDVERVFYLDGVLSSSECEWLIKRSEEMGYERATMWSEEEEDNVVRPEVRDNYRVLEKFPDFVNAIWERVKDHFPTLVDDEGNTKVPVGLFPLVRYYKYTPGQSFAPHVDQYVVPEESGMEHLEGCRSEYTFLMFLSVPEEGGATAFPEYDQQVDPFVGRGVAFRHKTRHAGACVSSGCKYGFRTDVMYRPVPSGE